MHVLRSWCRTPPSTSSGRRCGSWAALSPQTRWCTGWRTRRTQPLRKIPEGLCALIGRLWLGLGGRPCLPGAEHLAIPPAVLRSIAPTPRPKETGKEPPEWSAPEVPRGLIMLSARQRTLPGDRRCTGRAWPVDRPGRSYSGALHLDVRDRVCSVLPGSMETKTRFKRTFHVKRDSRAPADSPCGALDVDLDQQDKLLAEEVLEVLHVGHDRRRMLAITSPLATAHQMRTSSGGGQRGTTVKAAKPPRGHTSVVHAVQRPNQPQVIAASQAESASSILVTRSMIEAQVRDLGLVVVRGDQSPPPLPGPQVMHR